MIPLFIGGTGRSGTTVLGRTLSYHRDIFTIPFETRFIVDPYGLRDLVYALTEGWDQYHAHEYLQEFIKLLNDIYPSRFKYLYKIAAWKIYTKMHISPPKYHITVDGKWKGESYYDLSRPPFSLLITRDRFMDLLGDFISKITISEYSGYWQGYGVRLSPKMRVIGRWNYRDIMAIAGDFVGGIWNSAASRYGARIIAEHTPTNLNHVKFILDLFPEGKIIHIYRDPRDVVSSYKRQSWGGNSAVDAVPIINATLKKWYSEKEKIEKSRYLEISLENLVSDPEVTLRKITDFLGLNFDENMLKMDLSKSNSGRWRRDLSRDEVKLVERELGWFMKDKGYKFSDNS